MKSERIKERLHFWFLKYHSKSVDEFDGTEQFTLFEKIAPDEKDLYLGMLNLQPEELVVFILRVDNNEVIINTTIRFVHLSDKESESINYTDFEWHDGFKTIAARGENGKLVNIKTNGYVSKFEFRKKDGQIVHWSIPTGFAGFAFRNVTKRCELIGRKYN